MLISLPGDGNFSRGIPLRHSFPSWAQENELLRRQKIRYRCPQRGSNIPYTLFMQLTEPFRCADERANDPRICCYLLAIISVHYLA